MSAASIADFTAARDSAAPPFRLAIILAPGYALLSFASIVEPVRGANRLTGRPLYRWSLFGETAGAAPSNSGIDVAARTVADLDPGAFDLVILCAGSHVESRSFPAIEAQLRRLRRSGCAIAAVSTGSFLLARAGLLAGRRCTIHWDYADSFRETFPDIELTGDLFVIDGRLLTCAGATAALDMMLQLVQCHHGRELAHQISDQFLHGGIRPAGEGQRRVLTDGQIPHAGLRRAVQRLEASIETPILTTELAKELGISQRQLERLFRKYLGLTPAKFQVGLRVQRARRMLRQTDLGIAEIAIACGFTSLSYFAKIYRRQFGVTPRYDRQSA